MAKNRKHIESAQEYLRRSALLNPDRIFKDHMDAVDPLILEYFGSKEISEPSATPYFVKYVFRGSYVFCVALIQTRYRDFIQTSVEMDGAGIKSFSSTKKFDFDLEDVSSFVEKGLSLAAFIAYRMPANNLSDIITGYNVFQGNDFHKDFKAFCDLYGPGWDYADMQKILERTFQYRHIAAHELNDLPRYSAREYDETHAVAFTLAWFLSQKVGM